MLPRHTHHVVSLSIALLAAFGFLLMTGLVYQGRFHRADFDLTVKIQDRFPKRLDDNVATLIDFGAMEIQAIVFVLILLMLPLSKKTKLLLSLGYIAGLAVTLVGKSYLPHPAPPYMFQRGSSGLSFPGLHVQVDSSYPSGHTYRVAFVAIMAALTWVTHRHRSLWLSLVTFTSSLFAVTVMVGLIVLGKHWTSDVIGGICLAVALVGGIFWIQTQLESK